MQTNITTYATYDLFNQSWKHPIDYRNPKYNVTWRDKNFNVPAILIFGPGQDHFLTFVKENLPKNRKIIFEGRKAVNNRDGHGVPRFRNTLIVIDKCEDEALPPLP